MTPQGLARCGLAARVLRVARVACVMLVAPLVGACATASWVETPKPTAACAAAIDFWWAEPSQARFEYFRIEGGVLAWGGGRDAFDRRTSWAMPLSTQACTALADEVERVPWAALEAEQASVTEERAFIVIVASGATVHRAKIQADRAGIAPLKTLLDRLAAERLDATLEELPGAGERFDRSGR